MSKKNGNWRNRIVGSGEEVPDQLLANPLNWRVHPKQQQAALEGSLDTLGWIQQVIVNQRTGAMVDGHLRVQLALRHGAPTVPVLYVDLSPEEEAQALLSLDPIAAMAATDKAKLNEILHQVQSDDERVQQFLSELAEREGIEHYEKQPLGDELEQSMERFLSRQDVPDSIWPTDNDYGIPLLDLNLQATSVDLPFELWGNAERTRRMKGTWAFYVDDYRFEALWKDPSPVLNSGAVNAVEPNFSCYSQMPMIVGLWAIYRKRWIARYWQSYGLRIFADLNVAEPFYELNMIGIPKGWRAWATRGYTKRLHLTEREYQMACDHAGTSSILFVVYGGGKAVKEMAQSNGWIWFDEVMHRRNEHGEG